MCPLQFPYSPTFHFALRLTLWDELKRARHIYEQLEAVAVASGDEDDRQFVIFRLILVDWYAADGNTASDMRRRHFELAQQTQDLQHKGIVGHVNAASI